MLSFSPVVHQHKSLLGAGQEKILKPCILSNFSKLSRCLEENLGGVDEDVAGGGDDEEEVGEVDQPGLVQRDWGAFECLHRACISVVIVVLGGLFTQHNHLIYVEAGSWVVAHQLDNHYCQQKPLHQTLPAEGQRRLSSQRQCKGTRSTGQGYPS